MTVLARFGWHPLLDFKKWIDTTFEEICYCGCLNEKKRVQKTQEDNKCSGKDYGRQFKAGEGSYSEVKL